jgi:hypothetical protein
VRAVDTLSRVNQHSTAPTTLVEQPEGARQSQSNQAFLRDSIKKMMPQLERPAPPSWQKCTQICTHGKRNDTNQKKSLAPALSRASEWLRWRWSPTSDSNQTCDVSK